LLPLAQHETAQPQKLNLLAALSQLFKLKQTALLVFTGILGFLISSHWLIDSRLLHLILALALAISGTTGLNMFFDRDIDALMFRTRQRPLPSGSFSAGAALIISSTLLGIGLILAWRINYLCGILILAGFLINILLYTILLKRRTAFGLVIGSLAGGMPVVAGYTAWSSQIDVISLILFFLVAVWSLAHIWLIAAYYRSDYRRASLPILSVTAGEEAGTKAAGIAILVFNFLVFLLWQLNFTSLLPFLGSSFLSLLLFYQLNLYLRGGNKFHLSRGFKFLNPLLGITLLLLLFFLK
jgi:protoheme IX farnesyltransferase